MVAFTIRHAMRHSFFYLQRQVEVNFFENGGTWRWAFMIEGRHPSDPAGLTAYRIEEFFAQTLMRADRGLYEAKHQGRDRSVCV